MAKKIIFQKCNFNNIYFLLYIVAISINLLIVNNINPNGINDESEFYKYIFANQILTDIYIDTLSNFIAVIPYLIRKILIKSKRKNQNSYNGPLIHKDYEKSLT